MTHTSFKFSMSFVAVLCVAALLLSSCRRPADEDGPQTGALSLVSLTVKLNDGEDLIENFVPALRNWEIAISADDNKAGNYITIEAVSEEGEELELSPIDGTLALPIHEAKTLAVYPAGHADGDAAYTVVIIPEQTEENNNYLSMNLSLRYAGGANLIQAFSAASQNYSHNIDKDEARDLFVEARAVSSKAEVKISYDGSEVSPYKTGSNSVMIDSASFPQTGYKNIIVSVKRPSDSAYIDYTVRLNAHEGKLTSYAGTIVYAGDHTITGLAVRTTSGTDSESAHLSAVDPKKWTLDVSDSWTPHSFVVEFQSADRVSYKSTVIIPSIVDKKNITLEVGRVGKVIASVQDMQSVKTAPTLDYILGQDLDLGEVANWSNYSPNNFTGKFYGNGYTINNLVLRQGSGSTGFFASLGNNAYLEDFTINVSSTPNLPITARLYFGGVVGVANAGGTINIKGVKIRGNLSIGNVTTDYYLLMGGFFGEVNNAAVIMENCASEVDISFNSTAITPNNDVLIGVGGFIGKSTESGGGSTIKNCYSTGNITIVVNGNKPVFVGGFAGILQAGSNKLENCYATGSISVQNNASSISLAYRGGTLASGGLVGYISNDSIPSIVNCAALGAKAVAVYGGSLTAANYGTGRLVGLDKRNATYTNNAALRGMLTGNTLDGAPDNSEGGATTAGIAKSAADFKSESTWRALQFSESVWDFSAISTEGRPALR